MRLCVFLGKHVDKLKFIFLSLFLARIYTSTPPSARSTRISSAADEVDESSGISRVSAWIELSHCLWPRRQERRRWGFLLLMDGCVEWNMWFSVLQIFDELSLTVSRLALTLCCHCYTTRVNFDWVTIMNNSWNHNFFIRFFLDIYFRCCHCRAVVYLFLLFMAWCCLCSAWLSEKIDLVHIFAQKLTWKSLNNLPTDTSSMRFLQNSVFYRSQFLFANFSIHPDDAGARRKREKVYSCLNIITLLTLTSHGKDGGLPYVYETVKIHIVDTLWREKRRKEKKSSTTTANAMKWEKRREERWWKVCGDWCRHCRKFDFHNSQSIELFHSLSSHIKSDESKCLTHIKIHWKIFLTQSLFPPFKWTNEEVIDIGGAGE